MAGVHCEICGGNLISASKSATFVCEHCGIKYPKSKVRRMLFKEAGVDSKAPVTDEEMNRFHHLVEKYFKEENFLDAENMTNRILGADPEDAIGNKYFDLLCQMKKDFRVERGVLVKYTGREEVVSVPKLITAIGNGAFQDNCGIKEVLLPEGVLSLGHDAFSGCSQLTIVHLPQSISFIGHRCFLNCSSLQQLELPEKIKFIGDFAFSHAASLKRVNIPLRVTAIGRETFAYCESLETVKITKQVTSIGNGAFKGCRSLTSVGNLEDVVFLGEDAFKDCHKMVFQNVKEHRFMSNGLEKYLTEHSLKRIK